MRLFVDYYYFFFLVCDNNNGVGRTAVDLWRYVGEKIIDLKFVFFSSLEVFKKIVCV